MPGAERASGSRGSQGSPTNRISRTRGIGGALVAAITILLFSKALAFTWLNWDDQQVFVRNAALHESGLIVWAFTTNLIGHYQPVAWFAWGAVDRIWGLTPGAAHGLNIALHAGCTVGVFALARRLGLTEAAAILAALLFGVHPLRVEVVAWASAMPYSLALLFASGSALAYVEGLTPVAIACYAVSLLARPVALGLPAALFAIDWWRTTRNGQTVRFRAAAQRLAPFVALALVAAYLESNARPTATLAEIDVPTRLTLASSAPFRYLFKSIVPMHLTPLDPLALQPRADLPLLIAGMCGLVAITAIAWRWRTYPGVLASWVSFIALLAPAMGFVPSGLQATADRYTYLPAVPLSIFVAALVVRKRSRRAERRWMLPLVATGIAVLAFVTYQQTMNWRDSVALWTRAVEMDRNSDVALYNLASALAEQGHRDDAIARYEDVLRLIPDHESARRNRDLLRAAALEDEANSLAASGRLADAIDRYRAALSLDSARTHSHAALGMALVQSGRATEALPYLREAVKLGAEEPAVSNALAFSLLQSGRTAEACNILLEARKRFPSDEDVRRNLEGLANECGRD